MLIFLICFSFAAEEDITVCYKSCPNTIKGTYILVFRADDITGKIKPLLSDTKNNIYFYNATKFIFPLDLDIFQGYKIEFRKLVESSIVALDIDCTDSSNYAEAFTFKNINVNFYSSLKVPQLNIKDLEIEQTQIDLFSIDPKLVVETLITDKSMQVFSSVDISNSSSESSGITLKTGSESSLSTQAIDNGAVLTYDQKTTTFSFYEGLSKKRFNLNGATFCEIEYKCSEISKLIQFSINNINTLSFVNSWPNTALIEVENSVSTTLCANSTVLPVSLKSSSNSIIIITQTDTTITGDINSPVTFSCPKSDKQNRKTVTFSKSFSGSSLDLGSSLLDVTINSLLTDISDYGTFPFSFKIGEGGISTLTVKNCRQTTTQKSEISVIPEFDSYLPDERLENLLAKDWTILTLTGVTFSSNQIQINLPNEPFIHGFVSGDSCISPSTVGDKVILSVKPPSLHPLNVCYDNNNGDCNSDEYVKIDSFDSIASYLQNGVKILQIHLKTSEFLSLNFQNIGQGQNDCEVSLIGNGDTSIESIQMNENVGFSHLKLYNLAIGTTTFSAKEVTFNECKSIESSTFSFKNCETIHCDDDFISLIAPRISIQGGSKIKKISYTIDKFNCVTIADTKFIFYELIESSGNVYSSEISYDSFEFLDIIFDVGKRKDQKNNLNLTMETKNPPSFNITFVNQLSSEISNVPELSLFKWSQTKESDFSIYFIHNQIDAKIILTSKYRPSQLIPVGNGILTYEINYVYASSICSTLEADKSFCPKGSVYVSYDQLNDKLGEISGENIAIYIKSQRDNCPFIDLSNINQNMTLFKGLSNDLSDCIDIKSMNEISIDLIDIEINHLIIKKSSEQSNKLNFGNMKFNDVEIDSSFNEVDLNVNDFNCEFKHLSGFKTVSVSNNLIVNGSLSSVQSNVLFIQSEKTNRLTATVDSDASLSVGNKFIKIGETKFSFNSLANGYDVILDFEKNTKKVQINRENDAIVSEMPSIEIRKSSTASFSFSNNWKQETSNNAVFLFSHLSDNIVYLEGENTPASFTNCGTLTLVSKVEKTKIVGPIEFQDSVLLNVLYEGVTKSDISVSKRVTIGSTIDIKFSQPNVAFDVVEVISNGEKSTIQTELFSNLDGDSRFIIHDKMKNVDFSPNFRLQIPINAESSDPKLANYLTKNHPLIKVNPSDSAKIKVESVELIGTKPTSPEFSEENMKIDIDESTGEISLKFNNKPVSDQLIFCYEFNGDSCKHVLTEENIDSFTDLLPSGSSKITFIFGKENTKPLNLDVGKIKGSIIKIQQENSNNQLSILLRLGYGMISILSLDKVFGKVSDSSTFEIERIELLNGAKFDQLDKIDNINIDYNSVWKENLIEPCTKHIILNLTDSSTLTFTYDGFVVNSDSEIKSSSYPNLAFLLTETSRINLDVSIDVSELKEIIIYSETNHFILGSNWASIHSSSSSSSEQKIKIVFGKDVNENDIFVSTKSFPFVQFQQLMEAKTIQIDPSVLPYEVPNKAIFNNVHSTLDFSHVKNQDDKIKVTFKSLSFQGTSSLTTKGIQSSKLLDSNNNNGFPLVVQNVEISDDSLITLSNVLISDSLTICGNSILMGTFEATNVINMKWKLNKMPLIIFDSNMNEFPRKINFIFDESSIKGNENQYNDFLYGSSFEIIKIHQKSKCKNLESVFNFVSPKVSSFGSKGILDVECKNGNLIVAGEESVGKPDTKVVKTVLISIIAVSGVLVIGLVTIILVICLRRNPNTDIDSSSIVGSTMLAY